jgi:cytochrome c oxidase subunit 4
MADVAHSTAEAHDHPTPGTYAKIGLFLFVLTALEVGLYEGTYGEHAGSLGRSLQPFFIPMLLFLSAIKFALVAMFYMHLKQDPKLLSNLFIWPLVIAAGVIASLIVLLSYWRVVGGMAAPSAGG